MVSTTNEKERTKNRSPRHCWAHLQRQQILARAILPEMSSDCVAPFFLTLDLECVVDRVPHLSFLCLVSNLLFLCSMFSHCSGCPHRCNGEWQRRNGRKTKSPLNCWVHLQSLQMFAGAEKRRTSDWVHLPNWKRTHTHRETHAHTHTDTHTELPAPKLFFFFPVK